MRATILKSLGGVFAGMAFAAGSAAAQTVSQPQPLPESFTLKSPDDVLKPHLLRPDEPVYEPRYDLKSTNSRDASMENQGRDGTFLTRDFGSGILSIKPRPKKIIEFKYRF